MNTYMKNTIIAAPQLLQNSFFVKIMGLNVKYFVNHGSDGRVKGLFEFNGQIIHGISVDGHDIIKDISIVEDRIKRKIYSAEICQYCGDKTRFDFGNREYHCDSCNAKIGCHKDTIDKSLGSVANLELQLMRTNVHEYFDKLWNYSFLYGIKTKPERMSTPEYLRNWRNKCRMTAYKWLASKMDVVNEHCHIGMFDLSHCEKALKICIEYCNQPDLFYNETRGMVKDKKITFKEYEY